MAKRYFPQQFGDRKKARLDVTISDHNFPLSQNAGPSKEPNQADAWGDDNDDEILLLASQACEEAYSGNSTLPDYSMCMQPTTTSTQMDDPGPSMSKTPFAFKKPTPVPPNLITTNLKDKCNRISSPLPGMSSKVMPKENGTVNITDDLIFNDKIYKGQDSEHIYRQLLQLQEENTNLKSENGKLLEKCVTKEGEASILRTQLKSCQMSVDNVRLERIKAQEKVQMEWSGKMATANSQLHDLRTQLDFKNIEIISIKERCRMLESSKVKLTQITVANNDISSSHRNLSISMPSESALPVKRVKMVSNSVQTEDKAHLLKLNISDRSDHSTLTTILPVILEPTTEQHTLIEYNEKLQRHTDLSQNKCRVFSTFHRIPSTPAPDKEVKVKMSLGCIHKELTWIASGREVGSKSYFNVLTSIKSVLTEVASQLQQVSRQTNTAFQREMDERYIEATAAFLVVDQQDLIGGRSLFKEEQAILARRMVAILTCILETSTAVEMFKSFEDISKKSPEQSGLQLIELIQRICSLLDSTSCALLYSGLLLTITNFLHHLTETNSKTSVTSSNTSVTNSKTPVTNSKTVETNKNTSKDHTKTIEITRLIIAARPMPFVSCQLVKLVRRLSQVDNVMARLCPGSTVGNLRMDYEQGVLLYKKDSCSLQVLLKQVEGALKCIEKQLLCDQVVDTARNLLALYTNVSWSGNGEKSRCDCQLVLIQVIVYALRICAAMLEEGRLKDDASHPRFTRTLAVCRSGIQVLYQCSLGDVEFSSQLAYSEGLLIEFCELMRRQPHGDVYGNMLSELSGSFQSSPEDMTSSFHRQAWLKSFQTFSIAD